MMSPVPGNGRRIEVYALLFAVIIQLGYLVWGGGKLSAANDIMLENQRGMRTLLEKLTDQVSRTSARVDVLEDWRSRVPRQQ